MEFAFHRFARLDPLPAINDDAISRAQASTHHTLRTMAAPQRDCPVLDQAFFVDQENETPVLIGADGRFIYQYRLISGACLKSYPRLKTGDHQAVIVGQQCTHPDRA